LLSGMHRPPRPTLFPYRRSSDLQPWISLVRCSQRAHTLSARQPQDPAGASVSSTPESPASVVPLKPDDLTGFYHRAERPLQTDQDRKSTRLNSSHVKISYAVFCL